MLIRRPRSAVICTNRRLRNSSPYLNQQSHLATGNTYPIEDCAVSKKLEARALLGSKPSARKRQFAKDFAARLFDLGASQFAGEFAEGRSLKPPLLLHTFQELQQWPELYQRL